MPTLVIGLSGGIASGKTAATDYFHGLGVPIIDADVISRELLQGSLFHSPSSALLEVQAKFGDTIFDSKGYLARDKLRDIVFNHPGQKKHLEQIIHPKVYQAIRKQLKSINTHYVIISIPLLTESANQEIFHRIAIVDVPEKIQLERCHQRDKIPFEIIKKIIASQASREERLKLADDIIDNSGNLMILHHQLDKLHQFYMNLKV